MANTHTLQGNSCAQKALPQNHKNLRARVLSTSYTHLTCVKTAQTILFQSLNLAPRPSFAFPSSLSADKNCQLKISSIFYLLTQNMRCAASPCALTADGPIAKSRKGGSCPVCLHLRAGEGSRCTMGRCHWLQ